MLIPTIHFAGNCDEVIGFYKNTLGAEVIRIAYAGTDAPPDIALEMPPNFVMHSEIKVFGTVIALTDGCENPPTENNHAFTVFFDTAAEVVDNFNKLAAGGIITDPLSKQFWADMYGMVTDKYGVHWCLLTRSMSA
ncbi:MAG: VOC family protein [Defluviitaleaceae bacterium]|nr:VOC family protein [Defluviitaleaceae bacterium]